MDPIYADDWLTMYQGDCRDVMASMEAESVQSVICSPPYFGLRDYGLPPTVWGDRSDPLTHVHEWGAELVDRETRGGEASTLEGSYNEAARFDRRRGAFCACGAWLGCLGLEPEPAMWVEHVVEVFRAVRRVLRRDGTVWLNLGDSYAGSWGAQSRPEPVAGISATQIAAHPKRTQTGTIRQAGLKAKDRMMMPARAAIALQADGWWLRDEVVWQKPNPMPSSVEDRTTPAHEMVYLLSRSGAPKFWTHRDGRRVDERPEPDYRWRQRETLEERDRDPGAGPWRRVNLWAGHDYFYDADAIRERAESGPSDIRKMLEGRERIGGMVKASTDPMMAASGLTNVGRKRSVGGRPLARDKQAATGEQRIKGGDRWSGLNDRWDESEANGTAPLGRNKRSVWTIATQPYAEAHFATFPEKLVEPMILAGCPVDGVVPDPFGGSGTVAMVANRLGRRAVHIDLSAEYTAQAIERIAEARGQGDGPAIDMPVPFAGDGLWAEGAG